MALENYFYGTLSSRARKAEVLDVGCLDGDLCPKLLRAGARRVVGIDLSSRGIEVARSRYGTQAEFHVRDAHHTGFPDASFDLVCGKAVLHHLDWEAALAELDRVLRPGGAAVFMEPLLGNSIARLIRRLTPLARTKDELPLSAGQIRLGDARFASHAHRYGNLLSVPIAMITSRFSSNPLNRWLRIAHRWDLRLERTPFRHWMRFVVLVWEKAPANVAEVTEQAGDPSSAKVESA